MEGIEFLKRGYKDLIVSFSSGVGRHGGVPKKEFLNTLEPLNTDILFVTDTIQTWFLYGINSEIDTIEKLTEYLGQVIKEYDNVGFVGSSMGGYGAILFGQLLNPNHCVAFSPQTFLSDELREKYGEDRFPKYFHRLDNEKIEYYDLLNFKSENTTIDIYYGVKNRLDSLHSERMGQLKNVRLHPINSDSHNIASVIKEHFNLPNTIINSMLFMNLFT